jgi:small subunit ribosomal protein S6
MSRISGGYVNEYELMTVFHPRLGAEETAAAIAALQEQVVANGGEVLSTDDWGRRRLAYPINGVPDGNYVLMTFKMPATGTVPLERWLRLSESTLRHLLIRGIIPFEADRHGRDDRSRDDRDRDDRDDRDDQDDWDERGRGDGGRDDVRDEGARDDASSSEAPAAAADADAESEA